ncbi:MAG: helix-turn-helix transcriptional regulator [Pseudomonadota bacterium]
MTKIDQHLAARIAEARKRSGTRVEDAAKALELSTMDYNHLELGNTRVDARSLAILARLYDRPIRWFYDGLPGQSVFDKTATGK